MTDDQTRGASPSEFMRPIEDLLFMHPLVTGKVVLHTESIENLCKTVFRTVALRHTGLYYTGKSGVGKSWALEFLESYLRKKKPNLPVVIHNNKNNQVPSIRAFFKFYLATVENERLSGETADLVLRLTRNLAGIARSSGLDVLVLLIDEAQNMDLLDFNFLKDVGNELAREGASLITVLMGQEPQFSKVVRKIQFNQRSDLISRFVLRQHDFFGIRSADDLRKLLSQIDSQTWEETPGVTWTQFFVPEAYSAGFRLAVHAEVMFETLLKEQIDKKVEFPARQVFAAIREFLTDCASQDSPEMIFETEIWIESVATSAIAEVVLHEAEAKKKRSKE